MIDVKLPIIGQNSETIFWEIMIEGKSDKQGIWKWKFLKEKETSEKEVNVRSSKGR